MRPFATKRGRPMTVTGKIDQCASTVVRWWWDKDATNRLYNMAYFGKAMRDHVADANRQGITIPKKIADLFQTADQFLREDCDGKDCSIKVG